MIFLQSKNNFIEREKGENFSFQNGKKIGEMAFLIFEHTHNEQRKAEIIENY